MNVFEIKKIRIANGQLPIHTAGFIALDLMMVLKIKVNGLTVFIFFSIEIILLTALAYIFDDNATVNSGKESFQAI